MGERLRVLIVDPSESEAGQLGRALAAAGIAHDATRVGDGPGLRSALEQPWELVLCADAIPDLPLSAARVLVEERDPALPFIAISAAGGEAAVLAALRAGAHDFVARRDFEERLAPAIERARHRLAVWAARRKTEAALRASEARYRLLFESSPLPKWVYDLETLRFVEVNAAAIRHYGYTRDEFLAMTLDDIRPVEDLAALHDAVGATSEPVRGHIWRHRKKDGEIIFVEITAHTIAVERRRCSLVVARDVTESLRRDEARAQLTAELQRELAERKRTEEALRKSEDQLRQVQKMDAIGLLAGGVAHDFNNLLSVILSYTHMMIEDSPDDAMLCADLGIIQSAAERAAGLTRQLLAFSRRQLLQPRVLNLNEIVAQAEKMLGRLIGEDIELTARLAHDLGLVEVDPGQLEQVIVNLAVNARDAMPEGGRLTIETANVVLDARYTSEHAAVEAGRYVMLAVTDTGVGMDAATQARIFEPFFTTKVQGKGTGLGLSTVFGIVQQSGGHVWVYSEPGHGTTFKVYLPLAERAAQALPVATAPSAPPMGSETVLLVEDDPEVRQVARSILRRHGYQVIEAHDGGDALALCEKHPAAIDLLLTDVVMPRMSGRQLAAELRAVRPRLRVLFMSGYTDDAIVRHGVLEAGVHFLQKPLTPQALAAKVRHVLDAPLP